MARLSPAQREMLGRLQNGHILRVDRKNRLEDVWLFTTPRTGFRSNQGRVDRRTFRVLRRRGCIEVIPAGPDYAAEDWAISVVGRRVLALDYRQRVAAEGRESEYTDLHCGGV